MMAPPVSQVSVSASAVDKANDGLFARSLLEELNGEGGDATRIAEHSDDVGHDVDVVRTQTPRTLNIADFTTLGTDDGRPPDRRSVHVGVDEFKHGYTLQKCVSDAVGFAAVLRQKGFDAQLSINPTLAELRRVMRTSLSGLGRDDQLVVTLATHGHEDRNEGLDATDSGPTFKWSEIADLVQRASGQQTHIQVVVDTCYADNAVSHVRERFEENRSQTLGRVEGRQGAARELRELAMDCRAYFAALGSAQPNAAWLAQVEQLLVVYSSLAGKPSEVTPGLVAKDGGRALGMLVAECEQLQLRFSSESIAAAAKV